MHTKGNMVVEWSIAEGGAGKEKGIALLPLLLSSTSTNVRQRKDPICFTAASDISKNLIGQMRKQFLQRSWLALSGQTNHIWQTEVNTDFLSLTKKLIGFEWSNQPYMAKESKHRLSLPKQDRWLRYRSISIMMSSVISLPNSTTE